MNKFDDYLEHMEEHITVGCSCFSPIIKNPSGFSYGVAYTPHWVLELVQSEIDFWESIG